MIAYLRLLLEFQALPETPKARTFMEVSGYPHYENVASNLLAFFFDPKEEHGLGDLLLTSFISLSPEVDMPDCKTGIKVHPQYETIAGGFLDLLIEGESFVLGIENKIYHHLANDLADYGASIDGFGRPQCSRIKAILSLQPIREPETLVSGFVSHTYGQLWQAVRERMGRYIHTANPKWITYLIDFMETTTRLSGENKSIKEMDDFLIQHQELIEKLIAEKQRFQQRLNSEVVALKDMLEQSADGRRYPKPAFWQGHDLYHDFVFDGHTIRFDMDHTWEGWTLCVWDQSSKSTAYLRELISKEPLREKMQGKKHDGRSYLLESWDLHTPLAELSEALCSWINAWIAAASPLLGPQIAVS